MPDSDRSYRAAPLEAFFICLILIGVAVAIFATGLTFGVDAGRNEVTARQHYEAEKQSMLSACAGAESANLSKCIVDAIETAQGNSDSRQSLYAQKDMSDWAFWMMLTSLGMFFVSLLGVIWIKGTLDETRRAVRSADDAVSVTREIGMMQARAYLEVKTVTLTATDNPDVFDAALQIENVGQTPARDIQFRVFLYFGPHRDSIAWDWVPNPQKSTLGSRQVINVPAKLRRAKAHGDFVAIAHISYRTVWGAKKSTLYRGFLDRSDIDEGRPRARLYSKNNYST